MQSEEHVSLVSSHVFSHCWCLLSTISLSPTFLSPSCECAGLHEVGEVSTWCSMWTPAQLGTGKPLACLELSLDHKL